MRRERKGKVVREGAVQRERGRRQLWRDRLQRENKLDTGEDRRSQRMRRRQKIRTDC